jgi:hypothetical protein
MTALTNMPKVSQCLVAGCGYNHDAACHAAAVTIAVSKGDADCATFIPLGAKGGLDMVTAAVGACQVDECVHNTSLECTAPSIRVGAGKIDASHADCLTFASN